MNLNIKFADGNELISYHDDTEAYAGCETCDYGSEYINNICVETSNYHIYACFNQMYNFAFSSADAIKIFAVGIVNMTEEQFVEYLEKEFNKIVERSSPDFTFEAKRKE